MRPGLVVSELRNQSHTVLDQYFAIENLGDRKELRS